MPIARNLLQGLALATLLPGCGGGGGYGGDPPPPTGGPGVTPPAAVTWHGRYFGHVTIDGRQFIADALLTEDGQMRLTFGWPGISSGAVPSTLPEDPAQFVGDYVAQGRTASAAGHVVGEGCANRDGGFCSGIAPATATLEGTSGAGAISGELRVELAAGAATWGLALDAWTNYYVLPATRGGLAGSYTETLAEFVGDGDAIVTVDAQDRLFFQSAVTGCVGNGLFTPHLAGDWNVYDLDLQVDNCVAPYDYLNGEFEGLATTSASDFWAYDSAIRAWLVRPQGSPSPVAVTTWAPYNY